MNIILIGLLLGAVAGAIVMCVLWLMERQRHVHIESEWDTRRGAYEDRINTDAKKIIALVEHNTKLKKWSSIVDADEFARRLREDAQAALDQANNDARILSENADRVYKERLDLARQAIAIETKLAREKAKALHAQAEVAVQAATKQASRIISEAESRAESIAGKAYDAVRNADHYERVVKALQNVVRGYGDQYLVPAQSVIDELGEAYSHTEAGQQLKAARAHTKAMVESGIAAKCEYADTSRREKAEQFVLDAFNGKVDSILSRVKQDNVGTLMQEVRDAFVLVNEGGKAFREARVTGAYLDARIEELKWAAVAQELRRQEQEEQRMLRERIREEKKAQREIDRALRESAKQEEAIRRAMVQAEAKIAVATSEQREMYERQLAELSAKLTEAEERGKRALSMAQQTKRGFVYVISNIGSFGENIYKIGLTRRLEPLDRVRELGDSSVPFEFDVHALILSDDAPSLECQLHKHFVLRQVNKVNHRKEFFRAELSEIRKELEALGINASWTMTAEAQQYRETLAIEKVIQDDPDARQAWLNRQLYLDPVSDFDEAEDEDLVATAADV